MAKTKEIPVSEDRATEAKKEVVPFEQSAMTVESAVNALKIVDDATNAQAAEYRAQLKKIEKDAEAKRTFLVKPLNDHVRAINNLFSPTADKVKTLIKKIDDKMLEWSRAERKRIQDEEDKRKADEARAAQEEADRLQKNANRTKDEDKKAEKEAAAEEKRQLAEEILAAPTAPVKPQSVVSSSGAKVGVTKFWTYKVLNLAEVPSNFVDINNTRVMAAINAGIRDIKGLEIYEDERMSGRR